MSSRAAVGMSLVASLAIAAAIIWAAMPKRADVPESAQQPAVEVAPPSPSDKSPKPQPPPAIEPAPVTELPDKEPERISIPPNPPASVEQDQPTARESLNLPPRPLNAPDVEVKYDEFRDVTVFRTRLAVGQGYELGVRIFATGRHEWMPSPPRIVDFSVYRRDSRSATSLAFLADDHRILPEERFHAGITGWKWSYWEVTIDDFMAMVNADTIRGKIDIFEFTITEPDRRALRDFASFLAP